jgi:uncharacterized protein (TIGR00725 family)
MSPRTRALRIGVIGAGEATDAERRHAEAVGREIARRGAVLYCGGLGGVMDAAARGARAAGGHTVGIVPGGDAESAGEGIEFPIATAMGQARNVVLVQSCDAIVAIGGGYGTLSEIAVALKLEIPVVGLASWRLDEGRGPALPKAETPAEAVERAVSLAGRRR